MDNIRCQKTRMDNGKYNLALDVLDSAYFNVYDKVDKESGSDFLKEYLNNSADDADYYDVDIKHNKSNHVVHITAELSYAPNEHKDYEDRNKLI